MTKIKNYQWMSACVLTLSMLLAIALRAEDAIPRVGVDPLEGVNPAVQKRLVFTIPDINSAPPLFWPRDDSSFLHSDLTAMYDAVDLSEKRRVVGWGEIFTVELIKPRMAYIHDVDIKERDTNRPYFYATLSRVGSSNKFAEGGDLDIRFNKKVWIRHSFLKKPLGLFSRGSPFRTEGMAVVTPSGFFRFALLEVWRKGDGWNRMAINGEGRDPTEIQAYAARLFRPTLYEIAQACRKFVSKHTVTKK